MSNFLCSAVYARKIKIRATLHLKSTQSTLNRKELSFVEGDCLQVKES